MENIARAPLPGYGPRPVWRRRRDLSAAQAAVLDEVVSTFPQGRTINAVANSLRLHVNTVREHLEALVDLGLVRRTSAVPAGRGRPPQVYEAVAPEGTEDGEIAGLAAALAGHITRTSAHPREDATGAGRTWGRQLASRRPVEGASEPGSSAGVRRGVTRLLAGMGFSPEPDPQATTARLTSCPLLGTALRYPNVVCGVHLGIVQGALEEYGGDPEAAELVPFAEPGACVLRL